MNYITPWNRCDQTLKRALSECEMNCRGLCYRGYDKTVKPEQAFLMLHSTISHICFAILFCQKKVKKNCKCVVQVFFKKADMSREERHGIYAPAVRLWFIGFCNVGSTWEKALSRFIPSGAAGTFSVTPWRLINKGRTRRISAGSRIRVRNIYIKNALSHESALP